MKLYTPLYSPPCYIKIEDWKTQMKYGDAMGHTNFTFGQYFSAYEYEVWWILKETDNLLFVTVTYGFFKSRLLMQGLEVEVEVDFKVDSKSDKSVCDSTPPRRSGPYPKAYCIR